MKTHPEEQYLALLRRILAEGDRKVDRGTGVASYSIFGAQIRFSLLEGFPLLTTKKVYWKGVLHELLWFFHGDNNIKYLVDQNVHIWDDYPYKIYCEKNEKKSGKKQKLLTKEEFISRIASEKTFAKQWGRLPRIYGELWRHWPTRHKGRTVDQLAWLIQELRDDPNAHNAIVNSWNPEYLYTMAAKNDASRFPICHNMFQVNIIKEKVCLQLYQRSADSFLGVPFNIASYALLTHIIAKILGREVGDFVHTFGDVHIYENHIEQAKEQLTRKPLPFPTLTIDDSVHEINDVTAESIHLENYQFHPPIKAELTVAGGYYQKKK
jgi:thymidylate synthase